MNFQQMNRAVFERQPIPHVLFQPRFEPWIDWQRRAGTLPAELDGMGVDEIYNHVGCGQRYIDYYTPHPSPVRWVFGDHVPRTVTGGQEHGERTTVYHTPHGDLTETQEWTIDHTWRTVRFPAQSADDLDALRWLVERRDIRLKPGVFEAGANWLGDRGEPQFYICKSPYMALAQQYMPYDALVYALADAPGQVEAVMDAIDASYDRLFEDLIDAPVRIVNFGENIAEAYLNPRYMEEYLLPWYAKRSNQLRDAGMFTHLHIDGFFKSILGYLKGLPFDGLEALTPLPQGDVTIEEIDEHLGDHVVLDGIPAILFMPFHARDELQRCVEELVSRFHDRPTREQGHSRLILGISDELPQAADEEGYARLKWVADYAREHACV